jgi:LysR family transcriptional regulator for bpeEF and oprC
VLHARERPQGLLRVDVPVAFGRHLLVPALPALTERYPGLRLEVALNDRVADLVAERVDVALRVGKIRQAGLIARRVAAMRYVTVASPDYLARAGTPRSIDELKSHRCIGTLSAESGRLREWQFERGAALLRLRPRCHMSFNQPEAVAAAALAGGGIAQSVDLIVAESLATGRLREVLGEYSAAGPAMSIVYPQSERQSARVRVFADFCAKLLRDWGEKVRARR